MCDHAERVQELAREIAATANLLHIAAVASDQARVSELRQQLVAQATARTAIALMKVPSPRRQLACERCGQWFVAGHPTSRFCCRRCRTAASVARVRARRKAEEKRNA